MQKLILKEATGADIPEEVVTRRKDRCIQNLLKLRFLSLRQIQCSIQPAAPDTIVSHPPKQKQAVYAAGIAF